MRNIFTLCNNFLFIRTCRPYLEVLPDGFCKEYISNQLISQDDEKAANIDIHIRRSKHVLEESFIEREPAARFELIQQLNKFIKSRFFLDPNIKNIVHKTRLAKSCGFDSILKV